ncbi:sensor histidine kinase [Azovibrio sp.]|uniref:sensor histidine kinase n=1 Tax=Azovibrio sp. TaxID=1872673 RepID=UPI003C73A995
MKPPPSMRIRIAWSVTGLVLLLIAGQALALLSMYEEMEAEFIDDILAEQLEYSIRASGDSERLTLPNTPNMQLYRLRPGEPPPPGLAPELARLPIGNHEIFLGTREFHVAVREARGARFILRYDESEHGARVTAVSTLILSGALILCALVLVLVYALAGRLTRGLESLAARLAQGRGGQPYAQPGMERELLAVAQALDAAETRQHELLAREQAFNAHLSHELRTPLAGIRSDAELLAANPDLPDKARQRARRIIAACDRITRLATSLLLLARDAGPKEREHLALAREIDACWQSLDPAGVPALDNRVPPEACLWADPALLQLVLRNLLENAIRHGGGAAVQCRLEESRLEVRDRGPGLGGTDPERLFERFQRQGPGAGHGLGLTLVRHVSTASGWQAGGADHPQGGALFWVDFGPDLTISSQIPH